MDERAMQENKGLIEKIAGIVGRAKLPADACRTHFDEVDFQGKDAAQIGRHKEALIKRAQAAMLYFDAQCYYEAANSADRAAKSSCIMQLRAKDRGAGLTGREKALVGSTPYLSELAGNCYIELGDEHNAIFAYLKASKEYIFCLAEMERAEELLTRAQELDREVDILKKNGFANRIYLEIVSKLESFKAIKS